MTAIDIKRLSIDLGGIIAIVGGSGSGKTTLLNLLGSLEPCDNEPDLDCLLQLSLPGDNKLYNLEGGAKKLDNFPHDRVSYIFQQGYLLNQASLAINLGITRRAAGLRVDDVSLNHLLHLAQLHEDDEQQAQKQLWDRAITLSGGQQQRINIARALGREPLIIFADELTSSLDPIKADAVLHFLKQWVWQNADHIAGERTFLDRTVFWVTHDYSLACKFADALLVLDRGNLASGVEQPVELTRNSRQVEPAELINWVKSGHIPEVSSHLKPNIEKMTNQRINSLVNTRKDISHRIGAVESALGNMKDGIVLSLMEAYPPPVGMSRNSEKQRIWQLIIRLIIGFAHWVRALQLAAILALIMIIIYGQTQVIDYFDEELNDPALRHVIVQQNTMELERSTIDEASLARLSVDIKGLNTRSTNELNENAPFQVVEKVAFGRHTESVDIYPPDVNRVNPGFIPEATVGVFDSKEPVYAELVVSVLDSTGSLCGKSGESSPDELIPYGDELVIIITKAYLDRFKLMFDADLCEFPFLDVWDAHSPRTFRVAGVVAKAPADGYETFDIMLQSNVWRTWVSLVDKPLLDTYSRAAVYFNQANHSGVIDQLRLRAFAFDQEIIGKFERLIGTAAKLRNTFLVITWLTLGVAATVAAGLIWGYLAQNAQSIAVLRAHSAWTWPLIAAIPFQLFLTFCYGLFYLSISILIWNIAVGIPSVNNWVLNVSGGSWFVGSVTWHMLKPTLAWLFGSFVAMLLVGWICLFLWRITHRQLAHELRQAY